MTKKRVVEKEIWARWWQRARETLKSLLIFPWNKPQEWIWFGPDPKDWLDVLVLSMGFFFWSFMTKQRQNQFRFSQSSPFLPALGDREGGRSGIPDTSEGLGMKFGTRLPFPPPRNWEKHKSRERKLPQKWRILSLLPWFSHSERSSKNKRSGVAKNRNQSGNRPDPGGDSHQESSEQGGAKGKAGEMQRDEDLAGLEFREFSESRDVDVFLTISAERRGQKLMRVRD